MARLNLLNIPWGPRTHEGAPARNISPTLQLRRSVLACLLWENQFYEDGVEIAGRISSLVPKVKPEAVAALALEARNKMKLRHAPLLLVREMARQKEHRALVAKTLAEVIQRADELAEFVAIYWKDGKVPLSAQVKKGLAQAFRKFDEYQLAKYDRTGPIRLRDVLFLCHAKPRDAEQAALWKRLIEGELRTPDTWEVALSSGADKREAWERLLRERKLGALALLRNLRNMKQADVEESLVLEALESHERVACAAVSLYRGGAARAAVGRGHRARDVAFARRAGKAARADRIARGRFGEHDGLVVAAVGDASHRCGLRARHSASGDLREGDRLLVLERACRSAFPARVRAARRNRC